MARVMVIVGLVAGMMLSSVAFASSQHEVRLPVTVDQPEPTDSSASPVTVVKGDHLWKISARYLGPGVPSQEITPYWRRVVVVNGPNLRSGDPDLIYPGEIVYLPAIP